MQFMQAESTLIDLKILAKALKLPGMPSQAVIGAAAGVSQSTVSRAIAGRIGESRGAKLLWDYVQTRPHETVVPHASSTKRRASRPRKIRATKQNKKLREEALQSLQAYLDDMFDPRIVIEQISVLRRAQRVNARGRKLDRTAVAAH